MAERFRIGEFADLSGVSCKTLRFYDEIGLLKPASIDSRTRYRQYSPQQLEELAAILALKDLGISLADVRSLVSETGSKRTRRVILNGLKASVAESIQKATQSLAWITSALNELEDRHLPIPVIVKRRGPTPIASVRVKLNNYADIGRFEEGLLDALPSQAVGTLRGVLWHRCADSGSLEGEPFVALKQRVPNRSYYDVKQLAAATLACAYSTSQDDSAEEAYDAIRRWMKVRGYKLAGPKREIYLDQMLEVQFPIEASG